MSVVVRNVYVSMRVELFEVPPHILYLAAEPVSLVRQNQLAVKHRTGLIGGLKGRGRRIERKQGAVTRGGNATYSN